MAKSTFRCRLIAREPVTIGEGDKTVTTGVLLDDQATSVVLPLWDGSAGVLPNRAAFVAELGAGEMRVSFADSSAGRGGERSYFVADGFVQMVNNELTVLAAAANPAETLNENDARREAETAAQKSSQGLSAIESERLRVEQRRAAAKLRVAQSGRSRGI